MLTSIQRLVLASGLALCFAASGAAQVTVERAEGATGKHPSVGETVQLVFDTPPETAQVVWRPNSAIPDTVDLGATGGTIDWTPDRAGVATIVTPEGASNVSVRYASLPILGIFVLIGAGLILFGGAGIAMRALLTGDDLPDLPLDT